MGRREFSFFDSRHYDTLGVVEGYRIWADIYDTGVSNQLDLNLLERLERVAWRSCRSAVDLACGTGRVGVWLRGRGVAVVDGVDLTEAMLSHAERREAYRRLEVCEMTDTPLESGTYDLATNVLAVEHLADLGALYREVGRIVRPGGLFVLVGFHPHFLLNGIPTHFDNGDGENIAIDNHLHLLADHAGIALSLGWSLVELHERVVDDAWIAVAPTYERHRERPISFAMVWRTPVF